jgi:hypothetical protein
MFERTETGSGAEILMRDPQFGQLGAPELSRTVETVRNWRLHWIQRTVMICTKKKILSLIAY